MGPIRTFLCVVGAALLVAPAAVAQRVTFVSRNVGDGAPGVLSARTCPTERWTFRVASGDPARTEAPEIWLARGRTCTFDPTDVRCVRAASIVPVREARCESGVCWTFDLPGALLVDPVAASCETRGSGSTAVIARWATLAVAFPDGRIGWDTLPPAAPVGVTVTAPGESTLQVGWASPSPSAASEHDGGEDADALDASDTTDSTPDDASEPFDGETDVADVVNATGASGVEALRGYWLLCEAVDGVDAGEGECPSGGFVGLDVDDDAALTRFAAQCGRGTELIAPTVTSVTLTGLPEGRAYRFAVVAEDLAGNRSTPTRASRCATARRVTDFWERYRSAGGMANADCAVSVRRSAEAPRWVRVLTVVAVGVSARGGRGRRRSRS